LHEDLAGALRACAEGFSVPVRIESYGLRRYRREVETAVVLTCLEALLNVEQHAAATRIRVWLAQGDGGLVFAVIDDGAGFDRKAVERNPGFARMRHHMASVGGAVEVESEPGVGTTVLGRVPESGS
jgi:signal transduction histidine kinase